MDVTRFLPALNYLFFLLITILAPFLILYYLPMSQGMWLLASTLAFALLPARLDDQQEMLFFLAIGAAMAVCIFLSGYLAAIPWVLVMVLVLVAGLTVMVVRYFQHPILISVVMLLFIIIASQQEMTVTQNTARALSIVGGALIAISMQALFYKLSNRAYTQAAARRAMRQMQALSNELFSCLLNPAYPTHVYLFERRLHVQKIKCTQSLSALHVNASTPLNVRLNTLYDLLQDCAQVRWRVRDHSTFGVCKQELTAIQQELNVLFDSAISRSRPQAHDQSLVLEQHIQKLEELYQSVLQVVAPEPVVFLLFIDSLNHLRQQLWDIHGLLHRADEDANE